MKRPEVSKNDKGGVSFVELMTYYRDMEDYADYLERRINLNEDMTENMSKASWKGKS